MTDIVERLRAYKSEAWGSALKDLHDAANEIEMLRADLDCRTCRHHHASSGCLSVLRCVGGSGYQRSGAVRLWEAA